MKQDTFNKLIKTGPGPAEHIMYVGVGVGLSFVSMQKQGSEMKMSICISSVTHTQC